MNERSENLTSIHRPVLPRLSIMTHRGDGEKATILRGFWRETRGLTTWSSLVSSANT